MGKYLSLFKTYIELIQRDHLNKGKDFILKEDNDGSYGTRSNDNIVARYKQGLGKYFKQYANVP